MKLMLIQRMTHAHGQRVNPLAARVLKVHVGRDFFFHIKKIMPIKQITHARGQGIDGLKKSNEEQSKRLKAAYICRLVMPPRDAAETSQHGTFGRLLHSSPFFFFPLCLVKMGPNPNPKDTGNPQGKGDACGALSENIWHAPTSGRARSDHKWRTSRWCRQAYTALR